MLLRVLSNGLQLRLSETVVRVVCARCCLRRLLIKASTDAKALAAEAKSQRERRNQFPLGQIWDVWKTCNYLSQKQNEGSASGIETLGSQSKIGSAARLELPRKPGCA